ncbi:PEP-CTERM sorting domain-containing protein [Alteromonas sp. M12]|uniref:PEP-CTERM sorting domain-containing protein n=1 Tax=Alteromonas sp. M12 TaxID=3135644 RepID=UPI00319E7826
MSMSKISLALIASGIASSAFASPIIMEGDFVRTAVSDNGTLGAGGSTSPGILHDATGTATWSNDDYLTPGTPMEGFYISSTETGIDGNNNSNGYGSSGSGITASSMTDTSGTSGYDQSVNWTGFLDTFYTVETDTYYNDSFERISMTTTITALQDLTDVEFLRVLDPDPDVYTFSSYHTENGRGDAINGHANEDWVHAEGTSTGLTIGLYSDSDVAHNTGVSSGWSTDPSFYLSGADNGNGDYTIGIAFSLGDLMADESKSFTYHYIMGDSLDNVDIPVDNPVDVPEPVSIALLGLGLVGMGAGRRRLKK